MTASPFSLEGPPDTIDDLAARASRWIALEELLFETLGTWARSVTEPPAKRVFATWCHRHAWHAELWRARLPRIPARSDTAGPGGHDHAADVAAWIEPLQRVLGDPGTATSTAARLAIIGGPVIDALQAALDEHRAAIDERLDGPTARILALVGADLAAERRAVDAVSASV